MKVLTCNVTSDSNLGSVTPPGPSTPGPKTSWPPGSLCCPALAIDLRAQNVGRPFVLRLLRRLRTDLNEIQHPFSRFLGLLIKFFVVQTLIWAVYSLSTRFPLDWSAWSPNRRTRGHFEAELPNEPQNLSLCYICSLEQFHSLRSPLDTSTYLVTTSHVPSTLA